MTERFDRPQPPLTVPTSRRGGRAGFHDLAARALVTLVGLVGLLMMAVSTLQFVLGTATPLSHWRFTLGLVLLLPALLGQWLRRRGRSRLAGGVMLVSVVLAFGAHAWATGQGLNALALAGGALAVALAGVLASPTAAVLLALLDVAVLVALDGAERAGVLPGLHGAVSARLVGHLVLAACALLIALVVARLFADSLGRALHEERRLDTLLHIGSDWAWEMDPDGRVVYIAPSFELRSGRTVAEFLRIGQSDGPAIVPDAEYEALVGDMRLRRPFRDRIITYRCADATVLCVSASGNAMFDAGGRHIGWWGVGRNVTAERLAQQEQRRSQAMLDRLVRLSPDAICVARVHDGCILHANPAFLQYTGFSEAQVIGRNAVELGLWRDDEPARELGAALRADGAVRNLRSVMYVGEQRHEALLSAAVFEWDGEPVAVITTRDITANERARIEGDAILDNASVGIALVRERRFERVNPQYEAIFGWPTGSLVGQSTAVMFPDAAQYEAFAARSDEAQRLGKTVDIEREVTRLDGGVVQARLRARSVDPSRPRESGTIWVVEDITERRHAQRELAAAKQQAEAANEAKSAFLATMSHEIRTPLNGVLGLARLLQDAGLDEPRREQYLGHLVDAAELLTGIVSDVLDLSKIEAGHLQLEDIAFDLHGLVNSTFHTFAPLGREHGLAMHCAIATGLPQRVHGDPVRVRQILANYLNNALKFTRRGEITLQVLAAAGGGIRIEVRDSGIGVAPEVRERLFRPFTQADSSTTRRFGGTGLGLSICRELAERMGGTVGVESDGHNGSCFWAELALPAAPPADAGGGARSGPAPALPLAGLGVLVAEDNPVNMLIICAMLSRLGAKVVEADDGARAIVLAGEQAASLHAVLMDLHMPTVDGLTATRRLRADPRTARLPVFAFSAAVLAHEREDARAAGMGGFIAKPVVEADLLRVLRPLALAAAPQAVGVAS